MKNAIIYVFSGSGNTAKAARLFSAEFEKNGVATTIADIGANNDALPNPNGFDYVGIAYPIHGFNAPYIVLDAVKKFAPYDNKGKGKNKQYKNVFTIKTSGEPLHLNDISSLKAGDILRAKGYKINAEYHYAMPYNMIFRHTDAMAVRMNDVLKALAPIDAREVIGGKDHKLSRVPFGRAIAFVFRIEHPAMKVNGHFFKVDEAKCIHCNKCVKGCPVNNISVDENGKFSFGNKCVMCTKCSFNCPTDAFNIVLLNNWRINGKYEIEHPDLTQKDKHSRYCKKAYARYFAETKQKIEQNAVALGQEARQDEKQDAK